MLIRIVIMEFEAQYVADFQAHFEANKEKIRHFEGCHHLELWQDAENPCIFRTYSHWDSPDALEAYRHSTLFKGVWQQTKKWFAASPQAFSSYAIHKL
ncbi:MAG: antibiotic biosynthesis monooxygenase [Bernardetiaceae bacterium]|nr:antibiotic biosynthesis monooxygenase [Bernardetiaceae bacterium]